MLIVCSSNAHRMLHTTLDQGKYKNNEKYSGYISRRNWQ